MATFVFTHWVQDAPILRWGGGVEVGGLADAHRAGRRPE
jgi:hypothetical protein